MAFLTLQDLLLRLVDYGRRPALLVTGETRRESSYAELAAAVGRVAGGLHKIGVEPGEPVGLLAENRPEWVIAALAAWQVGAVVMPLDLQLSRQGLAQILKESGTRFLFTGAGQGERFADFAGQERPPLLLPLDELPVGEPPPAVEIRPQDPAALFYTSGTTGRAKGVPLSHGNLAFQLETVAASGLLNPEDRVLLPLPFHHVYPLVIGILVPLGLGLPLILPDAATGPRILRAIREGEATAMIGVPRLYQAIFDGIAAKAQAGGRLSGLYFKTALGLATLLRRHSGLRAGRWLLAPLHRKLGPSLRLLASGGSALEPELALKLEALGWRVAIGYGLTETAPLLTINPPGGPWASVGRAVPGVELKIALQPGEQSVYGEVLARGPNVFTGYRNLPEESAAAFTAEGWLRTGDLGRFDEAGYLFLSGRASTLIVTAGGKNIQPEPLEETLAAHPFIREAGVLEYRQRLAVLLVPELAALRRAGADDIEAALRAALLEISHTLPSYQRPDQYAVSREALPRTRLGKIRRHLLQRRYGQARREREAGGAPCGPIAPREMSDHDRALLDVPAALQVWKWLARRYPEVRLTPDTSPHLDMGVDSLEWLNLATEIGHHSNVELSEEAIGRIETVRDLLEEVAHPAEPGREFKPLDPLRNPEAVLDEASRRWLAPLNPLQKGLAWFLYMLNRAIARGVFRLRIKGLDHLPASGPMVFTPNHVSFLDPFVLAAALPLPLLRRTRFAGLSEVAFSNPFFRFICRLGKAMPLDPRRATASSLAFGALTLRQGDNLVWFPEGERSASGKLLAFRPGIGMVLERHRVPVIPVAIHGSYQVLPRHRHWPRWHRLTIEFGSALEPEQLARRVTVGQPPERIAGALRQEVARLLAAQTGKDDRHA